MKNNNLLSLLNGERPDKIPYVLMSFSNERALWKLLPKVCLDENTYCIPSKEFSSKPRIDESREKAIKFGQEMDLSCLGVGKGGIVPFGHGGPGEVIPRVIKKGKDYKIVELEGGGLRKIQFNPYSIFYGYRMPINGKSDLDNFVLPNLENPTRFQDIKEDVKYFNANGFLASGSIQGFFSGVHNNFYRYENFLTDLALDEDFSRKIIKVLGEFNLKATEKLLERGVQIIEICDDLGTELGLQISPEMYKKYFFLWHKELCKLCHDRGAFVHFHSHGKIEKLIPYFIEAGIDIMNPFDPNEGNNLEKLIPMFGDKIIFCGGIAGDSYLYPMDKLEQRIKYVCQVGRKSKKGYIIMDGGYYEEMSVKSFNGHRELFQKYR